MRSRLHTSTAALGSLLKISAAVGAVSLLLQLGGCANQLRNAPQEIVTQSDETDVRKRARLRLELASGYFEKGQATVALDEIKQSLAMYPDYVDALTLRGLVYMQLSQAELAEDSFKRATSIEPRNADAQHNFGWFLCRAQRYPESFARFQQAIAVPGYQGITASHLAYGVCQLRAGLIDDAERSLYRAFELDPTNPATSTNLALIHLRKGDAERARFYARKVNNSEFSTAESLWIGIRIERILKSEQNESQLSSQLTRRFANSREARLLERGAFNE